MPEHTLGIYNPTLSPSYNTGMCLLQRSALFCRLKSSRPKSTAWPPLKVARSQVRMATHWGCASPQVRPHGGRREVGRGVQGMVGRRLWGQGEGQFRPGKGAHSAMASAESFPPSQDFMGLHGLVPAISLSSQSRPGKLPWLTLGQGNKSPIPPMEAPGG